jgi:hypothetical protein
VLTVIISIAYKHKVLQGTDSLIVTANDRAIETGS